MPLNERFKARAEHNERLLATFDLSKTSFLDWAVVVAFYAAVRYVDGFFFPRRPVSHEERTRWVATDPRTRPIWGHYRELYNRSREARYELVDFTPREVRLLVANDLGRVKSHLLRQ